MSSSRSLIDENGNLFGVVNIIDALVVLVVLAVVVAGVGLVVSGDSEDSTANTELGTTHVTLDLGSQPSYIMEAITEGDTYAPSSNSNLTITDVYASSIGNQSQVLVRAELTGPIDGDSIRYNSGIPRLGRSLLISTARYNATGTILAAGQAENIELETTDILIQNTVPVETAEQIAEGDNVTVRGQTVAQVETVTTYATQNPERSRVFVGMSLDTPISSPRQFGGVTLQQGQDVSFQTNSYQLAGTIQRVGALEQAGTVANRTATLRVNNIRDESAETFEPGMAERSRGQTIANVTDVSVEPVTLVTTADNGSVRAVDHPYLREVTLTTELRVRETASTTRFKGDAIQQGSTVVINFGTMTVEAEVVTIGS